MRLHHVGYPLDPKTGTLKQAKFAIQLCICTVFIYPISNRLSTYCYDRN